MENDKKLICVICGEPWEPAYKNRCECGGFCTWGYEKGGKPSSWTVTEKGLTPNPPPKKKSLWKNLFSIGKEKNKKNNG